VWAGSGPLHSRPERRAGRHRPFWLFAAGCAAGCVQPFDCARGFPQFGTVGPLRGRGRSLVGSNERAARPAFPLQPEITSRHATERASSLLVGRQGSRWQVAIHPARRNGCLLGLLTERTCDVNHKVPGRSICIRDMIRLNSSPESRNMRMTGATSIEKENISPHIVHEITKYAYGPAQLQPKGGSGRELTPARRSGPA
jgi:hypothetical protein